MIEGFGLTAEEQAADEAQYEKEERERQGLIARCMEEAGFQYVGDGPALSLDDNVTAADAFTASLSPNQSYVAGLSPEDLSRYNIALTGYEDPNAFDVGAAKGCVGSAHVAIPGVFALRSKLTEDLVELEFAIRHHRDVVAAKWEWSECMISRGLWVPDDLTLGPRAVVDSGLSMTQAEFGAYVSESDSCAEEADLREVEDSVRIALESDFMSEHAQVLDE